MRDTPYATELRTAEDAAGQRIERLYVKDAGREEIRFSWWKNGQIVIRPLDLPEDELLSLMHLAIDGGVFRDAFLNGLYSILVSHLSIKGYRDALAQLRTSETRQSEIERVKTRNLVELLDRLEPIDEDWPEIDDPPPEPVVI